VINYCLLLLLAENVEIQIQVDGFLRPEEDGFHLQEDESHLGHEEDESLHQVDVLHQERVERVGR